MAFDFPATPAVDEIYTSGGVTYRFDGSVWLTGDAAIVPAAYVKIAGDTMTGPLMLPLPAPTQLPEATNKDYVDRLVASMALYQGIYRVTANDPDLNVPPNAPLNGYSYVAQTADPNIPEMALAGIPGIGGTMIAALDTIRWNEALFIWEHITGPTNVSQLTIQDAPPVAGFHGQQWWDSDSGKNYVWFDDGNSQAWIQISGGGGGTNVVPVSDTPPSNPTKGMLWFCSADASLYIYWQDAGGTWIWTELSA
jgi:hypothetical protein